MLERKSGERAESELKERAERVLKRSKQAAERGVREKVERES